QVQIAGQQLIAVYETGIEVPVDVSETARLLFNGIITDAQLYQLQDELEPSLIASGTVERNQTVFELSRFGGRYALTGVLQPGSDQAGEVLGVSTVRDPVKVFTDAGLYQVILEVTDPLGETSQKVELMTIDEGLQVV